MSVFGTDVKTPALSLCPAVKGHVCSVGALPANQQFELMVTSKIGKNAPAGEQIGVTINVQGEADTGGALSPAEASVATVLGQSSSSPPPTGTVPPVTIPPVTNPGVPDTTITPGSISSLFPTVGPSSSPPSTSGRAHRQNKRGATKAVTLASSSPIDPKLIGGQLAGLAVLAAAITMVVARLSLRTPQPATPAGQTVAAAPPPEPTPADDAESAPKDASESSES